MLTTPAASHDLHAVGIRFNLPGTFLSAAPYGSGHINDTYAAVYEYGGARVRYIHQRINTAIFANPVALMENIERVTAHQERKLREAGISGRDRRALTVIPSLNGLPYDRDAEGAYWRTYRFIEGARTYDSIQNTGQARKAARAFGLFQEQLSDLPGPRLHETIPAFHDTTRRFQALVDGYLSAAHTVLTPAERDELPFGGKLITFETGLRFLTDFLLGDTYFKTKREGHNLDRCRSQFRLVESIEEHEEAMRRAVCTWEPGINAIDF